MRGLGIDWIEYRLTPKAITKARSNSGFLGMRRSILQGNVFGLARGYKCSLVRVSVTAGLFTPDFCGYLDRRTVRSTFHDWKYNPPTRD